MEPGNRCAEVVSRQRARPPQRKTHLQPNDNGHSLGGRTTVDRAHADRKFELLSNENQRLNGQVDRLQERISTLERIVTDESLGLTREIEQLRLKPAN
jgi:hypothetical protein